MKPLFTLKLNLIGIFLILTTVLKSQCPTGDVILTGQADVNAFIASYPNCTELPGNLTITSTDIADPIIDLSAFNQLVSVGGSFHIPALYSNVQLEGLENLESVGSLFIGDDLGWSPSPLIWYADLAPLNNISGHLDTLYIGNLWSTSVGTEFPNVTSVGQLRISNNPDLISIPAFTALDSVQSFTIFNCSSLETLDLPQNLSQIDFFHGQDTTMVFSSGLAIFQNDSLQSISCNADLSSIHSIQISNNGTLNTIDGFDSLNTISYFLGLSGKHPGIFNSLHHLEYAGALSIALNTNEIEDPIESVFVGIGAEATELTIGNIEEQDFTIALNMEMSMVEEINWPSNLHAINGDFSLSATHATSIQGFSQLSVIGGTFTLGAPYLYQLPQMIMLESIGGNFTLANAPTNNLINFEGLNSLSNIGGNFSFGRPNQPDVPYPLQSLQGLEMLSEVGGNLQFRNLANLSDASALNNLTVVEGSLRFRSVPALGSSGFSLSNLSSTGSLILDNTGLESIPLMSEFLTAGNVEILNNPNLINTQGLQGLQAIESSLIVNNNATLQSIDLSDELAFNGSLSLINNSSLTLCATPSFCQLIEQASFIDISNNATGCQNLEEVVNACSVLSVEQSPLYFINVYSNGKTLITLNSANDMGPTEFILFNLEGKMVWQNSLVLTKGESVLDISVKSSGMYFLQTRSKLGSSSHKILVL